MCHPQAAAAMATQRDYSGSPSAATAPGDGLPHDARDWKEHGDAFP